MYDVMKYYQVQVNGLHGGDIKNDDKVTVPTHEPEPPIEPTGISKLGKKISGFFDKSAKLAHAEAQRKYAVDKAAWDDDQKKKKEKGKVKSEDNAEYSALIDASNNESMKTLGDPLYGK